jgi:membrane protein implicated in regulation of membrane protease activity
VTVSEWVWVAVWIGLVLLLGVIEIFTLDFIFIMLAAGAAAGLITALVGGPWWLAVGIAAVVSLLLIGVVRPPLLRALGRGGDPRRTGVEGLIGMPGTVAVAFTSTAPGQVRLANGETWSARIDTDVVADRTPPLGTHVVVQQVQGSTVVVRLGERNTQE